MMGRYDILVIDDDLTMRTFLAEALSGEGYMVDCCSVYDLTAEIIKRSQPRLVILELRRAAAATSLLLLNRLHRRAATRDMDLLVSSTDAHLLQELAAPLRRLGCTTLLKPFDLEYFLDSVAQALCNGRLSEAAMR